MSKKQADCERAAEWFCVEYNECVLTRRVARTRFNKVDFFAADVVGKKADGSHVYVQATTGKAAAVSQRKKKLEAVPWHETDVVQLVQMVENPRTLKSRKKSFAFKIYEYILEDDGERRWNCFKDSEIFIPRYWFNAYQVGVI